MCCPHAATAYVAHFPRLDEVVKRFHGLFYGGRWVESVDLEEVDVGRVETGEGGIDGVEDGLTGEACCGQLVLQLCFNYA